MSNIIAMRPLMELLLKNLANPTLVQMTRLQPSLRKENSHGPAQKVNISKLHTLPIMMVSIHPELILDQQKQLLTKLRITTEQNS